MPGFLIYATAVAAGVGAPLSQGSFEHRSGFFCVFWPHDAKRVERAKKSFDISWVFPDGEMTGHDVSAIEIIKAPKQIGARPRVVEFRTDGNGFNLLLAGDSGKFFLVLMPRRGRGGEYDAGAGAFDKRSVEYFGACRTIDADEKLVADLRNGRSH